MRRHMTLAAIAAVMAIWASCAFAHGEPAMPAATAAIFVELDDLDKLRLLNPLLLKADQIEKIIPLIKARQKAYNERVTELAVKPLEAVAAEIAQTRKKLLAGGSIP